MPFHPWWLVRLNCSDGMHEHYAYIPMGRVMTRRSLNARVAQLASSEYGADADGKGDGVRNRATRGYDFPDGCSVYVDSVSKIRTHAEYLVLHHYLVGVPDAD